MGFFDYDSNRSCNVWVNQTVPEAKHPSKNVDKTSLFMVNNPKISTLFINPTLNVGENMDKDRSIPHLIFKKFL